MVSQRISKLMALMESYDMYFTLGPQSEEAADPLTDDFLMSLVNMLSLKSGFSQILQILNCIIEILEIEIAHQRSEDEKPSLAIQFFLKSSFLMKIEDIYLTFRTSPEMIKLIGELLALCSKGRLIFPLSSKKKNSFLQKISYDIFTQTFTLRSSVNFTNYGHGLDALCESKIQGNEQILRSYSTCLSQLKTHPKSYQLACELFNLMLITDWSSLRSSLSRSTSTFRRLLSWPPPRPRSTSSISSSSSSSNSSSSSSTSFLDELSVVPAILEKSLECFDYHLKVLPAHFPARAHFIQLTSLAYRTVFYSPLSESPAVMVLRFHSAIQSRVQALPLDTLTLSGSTGIVSAIESCLDCLDQTSSSPPPRPSLSPASSLRTFSSVSDSSDLE
jgi:hypothetical protein